MWERIHLANLSLAWNARNGARHAPIELANGAPIQQAVAALGYESVPSCVTMFHKTLGTSLGR